MASTSAFLSNWQQSSEQLANAPKMVDGGGQNAQQKASSVLAQLRKQYPQRYMDNAVHFYANVCRCFVKKN